MSLSSERRRHIDIAIASGRMPQLGRSGQTNLSLRQNPGRSSYAVLSRADGSLTPAGTHYFAATNTPAPSRQFDRGSALVKRGANDYVTTRNGKLGLVRSLRADGSTHVTRLGKQYFMGWKDAIRCLYPCARIGIKRTRAHSKSANNGTCRHAEYRPNHAGFVPSSDRPHLKS